MSNFEEIENQLDVIKRGLENKGIGNAALNDLITLVQGLRAASNDQVQITKLTEENARLKSEIQLIEGAQKSAVRFNEENKKLKEQIVKWESDCIDSELERNELLGKLRVAKEAFKRIHYNNYRGIDQSVELRNIARVALAKLEDKNVEKT